MWQIKPQVCIYSVMLGSCFPAIKVLIQYRKNRVAVLEKKVQYFPRSKVDELKQDKCLAVCVIHLSADL